MKFIATVGLVLFCLVILIGCVTDSKSKSSCNCEACAIGEAGGTVWCKDCNMGFVDGQELKCKGCYQAKTGGLPCPTCKK